MIAHQTVPRPTEPHPYDHDADPRAWLEHFPALCRSVIANWFHFSVRAGHCTPALVVHQVQQTVQRRLQWVSAPAADAHLWTVLAALQTDRSGALAYAEAVITWERLPYDERQRQKQERGQHFRQQYMAAQPVTDKQLRCLQSLGYAGETPANRAHASALIDGLLGARRKGQP